METFLIKAAQLIAALALLVVVHEFGHYIFARMFGIRVEKFYLFFNPWFSICKWKPKPPKKRRKRKDGTEKTSWRDTEYGIGWIPLGGYCKIAGMIDESMDKEQMAQPAKPDEFRARPAYQRLLVMLGGVLFNFILACIIYIGILLYWGRDYIPFEDAKAGMNFSKEALAAGYQNGDIILAADGEYVDAASREAEYRLANAEVVTVLRDGDTIYVHNPANFVTIAEHGIFNGSHDVNPFNPYRVPVHVLTVASGGRAAEAGLEVDDEIISINGYKVKSYDEFVDTLLFYSEQPITMGLRRPGVADTLFVNATPDGNGKLGFQLKDPTLLFNYRTEEFGFFEAIPAGISDGCGRLASYVSSLKYLFTKSGAESIGGFGTIGNLFPDRWNWRTFWEMCAFLSIILAFMNILPIPALDGGHVMFVLYEIITRRKPSEKFLERAQIVGMVFLLALLLYANGNDIYKAIFK